MPITSINRRAFLYRSSLFLAGSAVLSADIVRAAEAEPLARLGLVTDLHHADKPPAGSRYYRETLGKFAEAAQRFQQEKIDGLVELGDIIDAADSVDIETGYLERIAREFSAVHDRHYYVLGNHCVDTLTKVARTLAFDSERPRLPIRLLGVTVSHLLERGDELADVQERLAFD